MKRFIAIALLAVGLNPLNSFANDGTLDAYGNGSDATPGQRIRRARGHDRDKEAILSGDVIQGMYGRGYTGSAFTTSDRVSIELQANQDWTTTANGTKIIFKTTPDDSTTPGTAMTIDDDGNVSILGTFTATGGATSVSSITVNTGLLVPVPDAQTIAAGNTIASDACGGIKRITAAGAVTTDTTDTFTAPSAANTGCIMHLVNTGAQNITLDNNALFVSAAGGDVVVTANDALIVACDGSKWYQISALLAN